MHSSSLRRFTVYLSHLFPLLLALIFTVVAAVPHLFFLFEGTATEETLSLFELMGNGVRVSRQMLLGELEGSTADATFAGAVLLYFGISVLCLAVFCISALLQGVLASVCLSLPPTDARTDKLKRWFRFLLPNRALLLLSHLLLAVPLLFPQVLQLLYSRLLGIVARPRYLGLSDLWLFGFLLALDATLLFATRRMQKKELMDVYRLYRKEDKNANAAHTSSEK